MEDPEMMPTSIPLQLETEYESMIVEDGEKLRQKERHTPFILSFLRERYRPLWFNLIIIFCLFLLVTYGARYATSLLAAKSGTSTPVAQTSVATQPTLQLTTVPAPISAGVPTAAPAVTSIPGQTVVPTAASAASTGAPAVVPTVIPTVASTGAPVFVSSPQPQSVQRQIVATTTQSQTVNATGQSTTASAKAAWGSLYVWVVCGTATFHVGDRWSGAVNNGVPLTMVIDSVPEPSITSSALVIMNAHIDPSGTIGNGATIKKTYGSYATTGKCSGGDLSWHVESQAPFVFGQDAQNTTVVQQSDINGVATSLQTLLNQSAHDDIQKQIQPNEHMIGSPQCDPVVSANHNAGDQVPNVTVTVAVTCKGNVST